MAAQQWIALVSLIVAGLALLVVLVKGMTSSAREDGKTAEVLRQVDGKLTDIRDQGERTAANLERTIERVTRVEESAKQAHHRIDELRDEIHVVDRRPGRQKEG